MLGTVAAACGVLLMVRPFIPSDPREEQSSGGGPRVTGPSSTADWQSHGVGMPVPGAVPGVFCTPAPGWESRERGGGEGGEGRRGEGEGR